MHVATSGLSLLPYQWKERVLDHLAQSRPAAVLALRFPLRILWCYKGIYGHLRNAGKWMLLYYEEFTGIMWGMETTMKGQSAQRLH